MDATKVPLDVIQKMIPYVYKTCLHRGIDITKVPLEVAPGSHTWLGGLEVDVDGRTRVDGLFAAGETAGGTHGGNRIGGSALSSALVFGRRAGRRAAALVKEAAGDQVAVTTDGHSRRRTRLAGRTPATQRRSAAGRRARGVLPACPHQARSDSRR